jgi:hypothetical protein
MVDKSDRFYLDPDKVRSVELCHQPPGRERVRVTLVYVTSEVRVLTVHNALLGHLVGEVRVGLAHEGDLGAHPLKAEVRVEADGFRAALAPGPLQHPRGHREPACPNPYLNSAATNVVPRLSMPPRSTASPPKRAFARRASSLKPEAFAKRASLAERASRRLRPTSVRICATRSLASSCSKPWYICAPLSISVGNVPALKQL